MENEFREERGQLRLLCHNIHKGLTLGNRTVMTLPLRDALHALDPDLVLLQEVVGENIKYESRFEDWPSMAQHEYFKSETLCYSCYGKNAEYLAGNHGNAILSREPFEYQSNTDVSINRFSRRGILHTRLKSHGSKRTLHAICTHFGLIESERRIQLEALCKYVEREIPEKEALVIGGDFNDWREKLSPVLSARLNLKECFWDFYGSHARSFPAWFPVLCLDRIYYRNLILKSCKRMAGKPWSRLSDHLPLVADFNFV